MQYVAFWKLAILTISGGLIIGNSFTCLPPKVMDQYARVVGVSDGFSTPQQTLLNDGVFIGEIIGVVLSAPLIARFGLRKAIISVLLFGILVNSLTCIPVHYAYIIIMRIGYGVSTAFVMMLIPVWAAELANPAKRGYLGLFVEIFNCIGILLAYIVTILVEKDRLWFINVIFGSFYTTLCVAISFMLPDSISDLPGNKHPPPSQQTLARAANLEAQADGAPGSYGSFTNLQNAGAADGQELQRLQEEPLGSGDEAPRARPKEASLKSIFRDRKYRRALLVAVILPMHIMFTGIVAFLDYAVFIFNDIDFNSKILKSEDIGTLLIGGWNLICSFISLGIVEKKGRRFILLFNSFLCIGALVAFIIIYSIPVTTENNLKISISLLIIMLLYILAFESGIGPCQFIILAECFPLEARVKLTAIAYLFMVIYINIVLILFSLLQDKGIISLAFSIYLIVLCVCLVLSWMLIPETKGKSLSEIERVMMSGKIFERFTLLGAISQKGRPSKSYGLTYSEDPAMRTTNTAHYARLEHKSLL